MNHPKVTVCIEQECRCGQKYEQVYVMSEFPPAKLTLHTQPLSFAFGIERKLELYGRYETTELNGVEMRDDKLLCKKCGKDVLFPDPRMVAL